MTIERAEIRLVNATPPSVTTLGDVAAAIKAAKGEVGPGVLVVGGATGMGAAAARTAAAMSFTPDRARE